MPNTKSAVKRLNQNKKKHLLNKSIKSKIKTLKKKIRTTAESNKDEAKKLIPELEKVLDKAEKRKIIHKNKAGRIKSRLMKLTK